jgi:membrane protease YdiL (CAAX protease family)
MLAAFTVFSVGSLTASLPLLGNLRVLQRVPWALPATLFALWLFWRWSSGAWAPRSTQAARRAVTRNPRLSRRVWIATLPVMASALVAIVSLRLLLPSLLPVAAPAVSIDLRPYPLPTVIGLLVSIAAIAAVTEEVAIRGYLQQPLESRYGVLPAILLSGLAWWLLHIDKVTWTHLPFHLFASLMLGYTAWLTRSLAPSMLAHFLGDAILQPAYLFRAPGLVWRSLNARPVWEGAEPAALYLVFTLVAVLVASTLVAVLALVNLTRITRSV